MLIEEKALKHWIEHFYGYGTWLARSWFVNYEDGGGDTPDEVAEKLNYFYQIQSADANSLCDIREFYRHISFRSEGPKSALYSNLFDFRFGPNAIQNAVWKNLVAFEHGYRNETLPDFLDNQKNSFASSTIHSVALIKLYPLPSPHNHAWYYAWLDQRQFDFLKTRAQYEQHVYPSRVKIILQQMIIHRPQLVLMYGMNNINTLKRSVQEFFPDVKFKIVKAAKQLIPQHHCAKIDSTSLVITTQIPTLRHNRIETGFDWQKFGQSVFNFK